MTNDLLVALQEAHAFNPTPRHDRLYALHVPFDELTGTLACEAALERALRQGHRVALVGASGTGKSSVSEYVLGPLVEGLAPMRIPITMERQEIATDPAAFAGHLTALIRRWVHTSLPKQTRDAAVIAPAPRGARTQKVSVAPAWMGAKVELAYELSQASHPEIATSAQVIDQTRQLIDLIRGDDLTPVVVLDDTDRWLSTSWQPDNPATRAAFFGKVVRILAEELDTAAVVAVHPTYLADTDYQAAAGFLDATIHLPQVPTSTAVARLLTHRSAAALGIEETSFEPIKPGAAQVLFEHYECAPNIRKRLLLIANAALTLAADDRSTQISSEHLIAAIAQDVASD